MKTEPTVIKFMLVAAALIGLLTCLTAPAQETQDRGARLRRLKQVIETQRENRAAVVSEESLGAVTANLHRDSFDGRNMLVYVPSKLPPAGQRGLLVALHGGGGNARFMQEHLKIDGVAEKNGFIVAYLEGTAASAALGDRMKAWNAGRGCCGKPYTDKVDDIGYITRAVAWLQDKYGADPARTFGTGHSNGAMMTQTLMGVTSLYTKAVTLAGTLMAESPSLPAARDHAIINYHGTDDINLPIAGGYGQKGVTNINFRSQEQAKEIFEGAGGTYILRALPGADHSIEHLSEVSKKQDGLTIGERLARDLGLAKNTTR